MQPADRRTRKPPFGRGRLGSWLITSVLLHSLVLVPAHTGAQPSTDLTPALIDQRLTALRAGDSGAAASEIIQQYEAVRASLARAESFAQSASDYIQTLTTAPAEEVAIRERLDQPGAAPGVSDTIAGLSLSELQTRLSLTRIQLSEANSRLTELDRQLAARESNAASIRARLAEITRLLGELPLPALSIEPTATPSLAEAREWRVAAERTELNSERRALEARLTSMPARYGVMTAQRTEQSVAMARLTETVREMESRATDLAFSDLGPEVIGIDSADPAYPVATRLIERDRALRAGLENLTARLTQVRLQLATIQARARTLEEDSANARRAADFAAGSDMLGQVLLAYWNNLPSYYIDPLSLRLSREVSETVLSRIGHETELSGVASARVYVNEALSEYLIDPADVGESELAILADLARGYRDQLRGAIATESDYIEQLTALDIANVSLTRGIADYRTYLEALILWAPTRAVAWEADVGSIPAEIGSMRAAVANVRLSFSMMVVAALAGFLALLFARSSLISRLGALNESARLESPDRSQSALLALLFIILRAAPVPLLLFGLAALIDDRGARIGLDLSGAMEVLAFVFLALEVMRFLAESDGTGIRYLGWSPGVAQRAEPELRWLTRRWLPVAAVAAFTALVAPPVSDLIIARIAMSAAIATLAVRLLKGFAERHAQTSVQWYEGFINKCALASLAVITLMVVGIVLGRGIGVAVLTSASVTTVYVVTVALLVHGLASGWLQAIQRRLRAERTLSAQTQQDIETSGQGDTQFTDWASIESRSQQLINVTVISLALITVFAIWRPWLSALRTTMDIVLLASESTIDGQLIVNELTLGDLIGAAIVFALTLLAARRLPAFLELVLSGRTAISAGARYAVRTLANYFVIGTGLIIALSLLGLDWTQLRWLVAALGVGIGFGLQEIVANFISGLILLFERPIRVGDIVTIGAHSGQVTRIQIRATTIKDWDGKELLVPNKDFITGQLTNWTLTDSTTRIVIPVGITYGSDVDKAMQLLFEVLTSHPAVIKQPPPTVLFTGFGDNSLNLEARCFVADVMQRLVTMSDLHSRINSVFKDAGIVIAFPQRDVHIDSREPFRIVLDKGANEPPG